MRQGLKDHREILALLAQLVRRERQGLKDRKATRVLRDPRELLGLRGRRVHKDHKEIRDRQVHKDRLD